jgi:ABC-type amino acid transport substrate-binding protein
VLLCLACSIAAGQFTVPPTSGFREARKTGKATISVLWYDIEPFIYRDGKGGIMGVEYELMEGFKGFVKQKYNLDLSINWVDAGSFEPIYPYIKESGEKGLFGLSFYSITEERKKEVKFSPPYMPDLNVLVTNNSMPAYETDSAFIRDLSRLQGFTMKATTMEEDLERLKNRFYPRLPISNEVDDYEVLRQIALYQNSFGYVPVSIYVVALQRGIKIKRQRVLATRREGFAAIYTKASDWDEPVTAYFNSPQCRVLTAGLIRKYLGEEVAEIIANVSTQDTLSGRPSDIELLTKEREIVTRRLIDTALDAERSRTQRNIFLVIGVAVLLIAAVTFSRFRTKSRLNRILRQRNAVIAEQKEKMQELNRQLNMKILQSKLNPHFLFNSLNAIQYHIGADDKKGALQYINRFAQFLRKVLQSSDEILIAAGSEAAMAEQYLWLEHHRFPDRFDYKVTVQDGAADCQTPPLLSHSLLREALYTNILNSQKEERRYLQIEFLVAGAALVIRVTDNGMDHSTARELNKQKETGETESSILEHRLAAINASAVNKVEKTYILKDEHNITEITLPQPLFHTVN